MEIAWSFNMEEKQANRLARLTRAPQRAWQFGGETVFHLGNCVSRGVGKFRGSYAWQKAVTTYGGALRRTASDNFLILSAARSGTTAMVDYLNCHPRIRCRGEILNADYLCYGNTRRMNKERLKLHVESFFVKRRKIMAGAKFLTYQLDEMPIQLADLIETLHQPRIIVLYRENILEQYASLKLAERTGIWHSNKPAGTEPIWLDSRDFVAFAERERRMWQDNLAVLKGSNARFVTYEQLHRRPSDAMRGVFEHLGLKTCGVESFVAKLHDRPLRNKIANYRDFDISGIAANAVLDLHNPGIERRLPAA